MDNIAQNKTNLQSLLSNSASIGIIASENQTIDSLSAALSLHLILQDSGKSSQIISKKDPIVEHSFLVGIDQLKKSFGGVTRNLTVSFPYVEGEIEKVSYNIEGDKLNVNLFGTEQGIKFEQKDVKFIRQGSSPQLIVTIGVLNPAEIEGLVETGAQVVNIDNNVQNALFGNVVLVDPSYSSLSEIVAKLAIDLGLVMEFDVAQNLLDGITHSTNNFSSAKTSPLAFEMAGVLMQKGALRKNLKDARSQSADTSLSMLNKTQNAPQKPNISQNSFQPKANPQFSNQMQNPAPRAQSFPDENLNQEPQNSVNPVQNTQFNNAAPQRVQDVMPQDTNSSDAAIPTEDEAPSDWFMPKVFKSNKTQQ